MRTLEFGSYQSEGANNCNLLSAQIPQIFIYSSLFLIMFIWRVVSCLVKNIIDVHETKNNTQNKKKSCMIEIFSYIVPTHVNFYNKAPYQRNWIYYYENILKQRRWKNCACSLFDPLEANWCFSMFFMSVYWSLLFISAFLLVSDTKKVSECLHWSCFFL